MNDIELIPMTDDHIELVRKWRNSKEVSQYMYTEDNISAESQKKWFDYISSSNKFKYWMISYDGRLLGVVNLYEIDYKNKSAFWAFYLGDTSVRGAGIGGKVEYNILKYVFDELNFHKLNCEVLGFNELVIKMHIKFGFVQEGIFKEHISKNNEYYDVYRLAIFAKDWQRNKETLFTKVYRKKKEK
jgi:UDP-4-amino-4,6-dideoxy-N-acetyl-beta-L-altrosamine N-acetyltransferase